MSLTRRKRSNLHLKLPEQSPEEHWYEGSSCSDEESGESEYDCGYLDLGAETPASESTTNLLDNAAFVEQWAAAGVAVPKVPTRRRSWQSQPGKRSTGLKESVDRDCGICFEYAVDPCRTLCCGKIFCTEHLADWLHGPNAEGRCPNCENTCSLEGSTLSLIPPALLPASQVPSHNRRHSLSPTTRLAGASFSSPLTPAAHLNDAASESPKRAHAKGFSSSSLADLSADSTSTSSSSTVITASEESEDGDLKAEHHKSTRPFIGANTSTLNLSTTPFSTSWGAVSRLMSIITFLMFLYKLLS
ncbi:unnamed protein product [Cyclocybe aegerita]|uniref:RING-type domain-containing protein n=1 Tax=Cyclocybe aegerita TaxID=1973307 RepID=A0A8S0W4W7_CYCAE|nr:unnamed protein product [Cyclocybe aegerita]